MEFKDIIRQLRNEKGMNTTQLAGQFEKTEAAIRAWESGRSKPDADTLVKLAAYFDCTIDYLLGLSDFKTHAEQNEHKKVLGEALSNLDEAFGKLDSQSHEMLANALVNSISAHSNHVHAKNNVATVAGLINGLSELYKKAVAFADEKSESALFKFLGKYYNFEGYVHQIDVAEVVFEELFDGLIDSDIFEAERIYKMLEERFTAPRSRRYDEYVERLEQRRVESDAVGG
ncbi:MAG: helix-turn-helix domain-containing protein [Defluviitaleaceae bacterium]|nr:helix-turn-helix domain-containing protein [Defluviitaleaceae bacterium]